MKSCVHVDDVHIILPLNEDTAETVPSDIRLVVIDEIDILFILGCWVIGLTKLLVFHSAPLR